MLFISLSYTLNTRKFCTKKIKIWNVIDLTTQTAESYTLLV